MKQKDGNPFLVVSVNKTCSYKAAALARCKVEKVNNLNILCL